MSDKDSSPTTTEPRLVTRTGIVLDVRAATPADANALATFFDAVSDEDRRFRFLAAADHVGHAQLEPLIHAERYSSQSYLAFDSQDDTLVASGVLASDAEGDTGEIAVSVRADYKGKGVGWAMLDYLAKQARTNGLRQVISIEARANHAAIEVERDKGFLPQPCEGDPTVVVLAKTLR